MKKVLLAALLIGSTATALAQDQMRDTAVQLQAGRDFAQKLVQNAVPEGNKADVLLTYEGPKGFGCVVRIVNGAGVGTTVTERADSPERACVKAVLTLNRDKAF